MSTLVVITRDSVDTELFKSWHVLALSRMGDVHANRRQEWALARAALSLAFSKHGVSLRPEHCVFKGHHELNQYPQWRFSLSHTKNAAGAWLAPTNSVRGLGLDIEYNDRKVSASVKARLAHSEDMALSTLELWSLKEAAYKALPAMAQENIWLNRIKVTPGQFELTGSPFRGFWETASDGKLLVSKAWLSA